MKVLLVMLFYVFAMSYNVELLCDIFGFDTARLQPHEVKVLVRYSYAILFGFFATPFLVFILLRKNGVL